MFGIDTHNKDTNIEYSGLHGGVSLKSKQYPYLVDSVTPYSDQELIDKIETLAVMPICEIVTLIGDDYKLIVVSDISLFEVYNKLLDGYTPIPF